MGELVDLSHHAEVEADGHVSLYEVAFDEATGVPEVFELVCLAEVVFVGGGFVFVGEALVDAFEEFFVGFVEVVDFFTPVFVMTPFVGE